MLNANINFKNYVFTKSEYLKGHVDYLESRRSWEWIDGFEYLCTCMDLHRFCIGLFYIRYMFLPVGQ